MTDEELKTEAQQESDANRQATIDMTANGGADYQAQIDAVESNKEREQEIINRQREHVEERRRARYEQQDGRTSKFDKEEIESERKDLSYSNSRNPVEFSGGSTDIKQGMVTTFNGIQYPKQEDTKREASVPIAFDDNYIAPKKTPPAYNPGAYSILGKNYGTSQKQRATVQKDAGTFMRTPEFKTLYAGHKENALQQGRVFDFMNPSPEKVSEVRAAGVYNLFSGKSEKPKRIKENPESYSILGSKYFSPTKAGETQRKKVQTKAEAFQGTTQFANRLGMVFTEVAAATGEREKHEALVAKANAKRNPKVGTDSLSQYIPKMGISGGLSYSIPQTFSVKRRDETKQEGGTVGVPVKERKTGKIQGVRAPASEKDTTKKILDLKGKGISQEVLKQREENKQKKAAEKLFKDSLPPRTPVAKLDPIVDAGMASYFKTKDVALYKNRKQKIAEETAIKTNNAALRKQRKESLEYSANEEKLQSASKESSLFGIALSASHDIVKRETQASQDAESKRQLKQQDDAYKNIAKTMDGFARGAVKAAEEEKKKRAAHARENPKWLAKRAATISRNAETESLRKKAYREKTPVLNQITDMLGGEKGKKPHNFKPGKGEGGIFDKKVEQPVFDSNGNEIGTVTKKVNMLEEFGEKHPILASMGSHVKKGAMQPLRDLEAGRKARAAQQKVGFLYGGGLQPVNVTQKNPEGEFPNKSGKTAAPRRKDRIGGTELSFFGKPFGAPKAPRRTRRGKIIKMTPAQRKRAARRPKTFLDDVFSRKW